MKGTRQDYSTGFVRRLTLHELIEEAGMSSDHVGGASSRRKESGWHGGTLDEAMRMAVQGYPGGALRLRKRLGAYAGIHKSRRPAPRWDVSGSAVDVGRYLAGEPDCMVETVRVARQSPVLRIAVERAVSHTVSADDIEATGASVLALVEGLRTAGIPSEVWVTFTVAPGRGGGSWQWMSTQVLIQEAGRPIDLDVLAYWAMHPTALRRLVFSVWEHEDERTRKHFGFGGSYGIPTRVPQADRDMDEYAPARANEVEAWVAEVLQRRVGITLKREER